MTRFTSSALCACLLAGVTACGEAPPADGTQADAAAPGPGLQQLSFTGVGDPATGRLQIFMGPQAAIGTIGEDTDGSAATVAANRAQVYGATVNFASGGVGYPAGCSTSSPWAMSANVEVFSGFPEQLRNVYARITSQSAGPTFCTVATPGAIAPPAGTYSGLYFYQPLNNGTSPSLIRRSVQWSMSLPNNNPFWFSGDLWAEVIPAPMTLAPSSGNTNPADDAIIHTGGSGSSRQNFSWINDPRADGSNSGENYAVARPNGGASLTVMQCGSSAQPFNSALCTTFIVNPRLFTQGNTSYSRRYNAGSWYQWSLRTSFQLPGSGARILGSTLLTRHFAVVNP